MGVGLRRLMWGWARSEGVKRPLAPLEAQFTLSCVSGLNGRSRGETQFTQKLTDSADAQEGCLDQAPGRTLSRGQTPSSRGSG